MGRPDMRQKETFILYTTRKLTRRHGIDAYIAGPECMNYCPRCLAMTRRIETLFGNVDGRASDRKAELCEIFSCPPCADLVDKYCKFTAEDDLLNREHDSELIHLQRLTSPSQDAFGAARTKFEDLVMGAAKDNVLTKKERDKDDELTKKETAKDKDPNTKTLTKKERYKNNELSKKETAKDKETAKNKETAKDKDLKTKSSKLPTLSKDAVEKTAKDKGRKKKESDVGDKDLKPKSHKAQKSDKISRDTTKTIKGGDKISKVANVDSKKEKTGKTPKAISETKITKKATQEPPIKSKSATKLQHSARAAMNASIRLKIADHLHRQAQEDKANRLHALQMLKQKKDMEAKLSKAEKKEEEARDARARAEEARQLKFKAAMQYDGPEGPGSGDRETDVCSDETVVDCMIKGVKIVKASAVEQVDIEKPIAAVFPATTSRSSVAPPHPPPTPNTDTKTPDPSIARHLRDARVSYELSERKYVDKGWTLLPKEIVMRKVTLFHMHPARNEFDWLEMNRHKERVMYDSGEQLATFDENGCAKVYYRSGVLAFDFYQAEDKNAGGRRVVVYSDSKAAERGRAPVHAVLATFDYSGNGVVFDHAGQPRLKYSQNDGVVLDRNIGPYTHWKWHNLNDAGRLQTVMVENEPLVKDPRIILLGDPRGKREKPVRQDSKSPDKSVPLTSLGSDKSIYPDPEIELGEPLSNDEMVMRGLEADNVVRDNYKLLKGFSPYQIRMKAFKINDNFSLRIIDQSSVFLTFTDGKTRLRINVGMVMDPTVVLGQDLVDVWEVTTGLEKIPATESLEELHRVVRGARAAERARVLREARFSPPVSSEPLASSVKGRSQMRMH